MEVHMAEFKFNCPKCNAEFNASDSLIGNLANCSQCKARLRKPASSQSHYNWGKGSLLFGLLILITVICSSCSHNIESVAEAEEEVIGTWTGLQDMGGLDSWHKLIFNKDGTYLHYFAWANEAQWGNAKEKGTWKAGQGKYIDTGHRYYYIEISKTSLYLANEKLRFSKNDNLVILDSEGQSVCILEKKDKSPFD